MRSFDDDADTETLKKILSLPEGLEWNTEEWEIFDPLTRIDWDRVKQEDINQWYEKRIQKLVDNAGKRRDRQHCMVAKNYPEGEIKADPVMIRILSKLFEKLGIPFGIGWPYFLCSRMSHDQIQSLVDNGLLVDLVKEDLAKDPGAQLDKLKADPEKIQQYAQILAEVIIIAQKRRKIKNKKPLLTSIVNKLFKNLPILRRKPGTPF